jgi:hypothetical protein
LISSIISLGRSLRLIGGPVD